MLRTSVNIKLLCHSSLCARPLRGVSGGGHLEFVSEKAQLSLCE